MTTDQQRTTHEVEHRHEWRRDKRWNNVWCSESSCRTDPWDWSQGEIRRLTEAYTDLSQRFALLYDDNNALDIEIRRLRKQRRVAPVMAEYSGSDPT